MKKYFPFIIVGTVAILTVASATVLYHAKRPAPLTIPKNAKTSEGGKNDARHIRGNANAPVTLEEFGDFECPPCGALSGVIAQLEQDYRSQVRVIYRHFPLLVHAHARDAAFAAEAAGLQGRFWEMHDLLYKEQREWSKAPDPRLLFQAYAGMLGLNAERFKKDIEGDEAKMHVRADQESGAKLGVKNTPTIFINNVEVQAASLSPPSLRAAVDAAVKSSSKNSAEKEKAAK